MEGGGGEGRGRGEKRETGKGREKGLVYEEGEELGGTEGNGYMKRGEVVWLLWW